MRTTVITEYAGEWLSENENLIESLVGDAMFQIEHLLVEIEALRMKDRAKSGSLSEPTGWPRD